MPVFTSSSLYDAVICDIDGCLGPESAAPLDAPHLAEIAAWNAAASSCRDRPILTVCSGRPQPYAEAITRLLGNALIPCVCENGVWLYDPRLNRYLLDPRINADHRRAVHEASLWIDRTLGPKGVVIQPGKTASISLWHPDTGYLMGLRPLLRDAFAREGWPLRVSNTVAWINCDLEIISKATGVERLMAEAGLTKGRLAGIGDTTGDLAIREHVAFFACPGNAEPEIKRASDYTASAPEVDGVLEILHRLAP